MKVLFVHVPWLATASGGGIGWSSLSPGEACRLGRFLPNCAEVPGELGDMYADAAAVSEAVATAGEPVILCGHSYGGTVITEAGAGEPNADI